MRGEHTFKKDNKLVKLIYYNCHRKGYQKKNKYNSFWEKKFLQKTCILHQISRKVVMKSMLCLQEQMLPTVG